MSNAYRPLACAVINRAVMDLQKDPKQPANIPLIQKARTFLCERNADLDLWCRVAEIHPDAVIKTCNRILFSKPGTLRALVAR